MGDPRGFLKYKREGPQRRPVEIRVKDWGELYEPFPDEKLKVQGARCMDCGVPFCQSPTGCPVVNLIPEWNDLVHRERWRDALKALHATNNFPEFTGRLCPAPCESACVLGINSDPVSIRVIEWNIIDKGFEEGWVEPVLPVVSSGKKVAVVGSGPAGLAAAQQLARAGHQVTVLEKADRIGGLLRYGIPDFKMEKWVLDRRLEQMQKEGVTFETGVCVGVDIDIPTLRRDYDAVLLAMGAEQPRELPIPGRELHGVHLAMDYLTQQNKRVAGDAMSGEAISAQGKRVVIIGGGDTGSDCLGTAHRQGCAEAHQFELLPEPPSTRAPKPSATSRRSATRSGAVAASCLPMAITNGTPPAARSIRISSIRAVAGRSDSPACSKPGPAPTARKSIRSPSSRLRRLPIWRYCIIVSR